MKTPSKLIALFSFSIILVFTSACKKNSTGGKAEVHVIVTNNGTPIYHSNAYVKFGTNKAPSDPTSNYDLMAHGEETDNHVHIEDLRPGTYYITAVGINTITGKTVQGGTSVEIKWKDRKNTLEADINAQDQ